MKSYYNLPKKVIFCTNCVMSNQRPSSIAEFKHLPSERVQNILILTRMDYVMLVNLQK